MASNTTRNTVLAILGFFIGWLALDRLAVALGSFRGEWGLPVALATLAVLILFEIIAFRTPLRDIPKALGFVRSRLRPSLAILVLCLALIGFLPAYALATGTPIALDPAWPIRAIGIFLQAGIAEETLFRGFLFRHLRQDRGFWSAALLSAVPFVAVHLILFDSNNWQIALAAVLVSVSLSFPLAWAFERTGNSVWMVALLHAVIQGCIKLVLAPEQSFLPMALVWMVVSALLPWLLFMISSKNHGVAQVNSKANN